MTQHGDPAAPPHGDFFATYLYAEEQDGLVMVGFADSDYETRDYLLMQRPLAPSGLDPAPAADEIRIQRNDEAHAARGGIRSFDLFEDRASIEFEPAAAKQLAIAPQVVINFSTCSYKFREVRTHMQKLFAGHPGYTDHAGPGQPEVV
jgi:hypothetical protein